MRGWNTWDVDHLNGLVYLPDGLRVRVFLVDEITGEVKQDFWQSGEQSLLGAHSGQDWKRPGGYAEIGLRWARQDGKIQALLRYAAQEEQAAIEVMSLEGSAGKLRIMVDGFWGAEVSVQAGEDLADVDLALLVDCGGRTWQMAWQGAASQGSIARMEGVPVLQGSLTQGVKLALAPRGTPLPEAASLLSTQQSAYQERRLRTQGWLQDAADGLTRALHWNTIWEPRKGRVCSPVSRDWSRHTHWGGYVLFDWDTFFAAVMCALEDPSLAEANLRAILQEVTPRGFVPNFGAASATSEDRSQPPVGGYCALKVAGMSSLSGSTPAWVGELFTSLSRWHDWWFSARDGNRDGLLEWGSDPLPSSPWYECDTIRAAMYESGLDNSPMYDEVVFNPETHTMELADVGLNALYALDAWALAELAQRLGKKAEAARLREEYAQMTERINTRLWDETVGLYRNRHWDGRFSNHHSPTLFYPLLAGIVPAERAVRMIAGYLMDEESFWGEYVLPSIARDDPGYRQVETLREGMRWATHDYWRGRIWPPMNFLVGEGLRRAGRATEATLLAEKSLRLFLQEWQAENHIHENYNDLTGEGDDVPNSHPVYHWGALLAFLALQELADYQPWEGGWRFGDGSGKAAALHNLSLAEGHLSVESGPQGLKVILDGSLLVETDAPVVVSGYQRTPEIIKLKVSGAADACELRLGGLPQGDKLLVTLNGDRLAKTLQADGILQLEVSLPAVVWVEV